MNLGTMLVEAAHVAAAASNTTGLHIELVVTTDGIEVRGVRNTHHLKEVYDWRCAWSELDAAHVNILSLGVGRVLRSFGL